MTNPPDPKTKTPRGKLILEGIGEQNEPATWEGRNGFWVQGDCIFIEAESPQAAIAAYRKEIVATSHNHFCGSIMREKDRFRADALELENQSLARRLEEAEKEKEALMTLRTTMVKDGRDEPVPTPKSFAESVTMIHEMHGQMCDFAYAFDAITGILKTKRGNMIQIIQVLTQLMTLPSKLTALRTAAEAAMKALELANVTDEKFNEKNADFIEAALAALRAVLGQAASNASNSPTASRDTQG